MARTKRWALDFVRLFGDDNVLSIHDSNFTNLITNISAKFVQLYDWCLNEKKITIAINKTKFVLVRATNKPVSRNEMNCFPR